MFDSTNNDSFPFTIDPYFSSFLHSPLMCCEFDNEFLISNEEQLTVIQPTEIMKPDCDTASFIRASNCNLVEAASTDLNSSDINGIVEDANTRSAINSNISTRRLLPAAAAAAAAARRISKRDRHSKIHTAQGPRDRRVRLSLDVARDFFKLQDMLRFDKPSRTVNWLLMQSEPAIQQLIVDTRKESRSLSSNKNASSTSECCGELENANAIDHDEITTANRSSVSHSQQQQQEEGPGILIKSAGYKPTDHHKDHHRKGRQQSARSNCRGSLLSATCPKKKESRNRARYLARKRTEEKLKSRTRKLPFDQQKIGRTDTNSNEVIMQHHQEQQSISQKLRVDSCGPFETTGEESGSFSQNMKPLGGGEVQSEIHDPASQSERDHHVHHLCGSSSSLAPAENWSPFTAFYYPHNQEICQVCPATEFQCYGTSWDA